MTIRRTRDAWPTSRSDFRRAASAEIASRCRSEEHTSELQSHSDLVCRLLLEKKKKKKTTITERAVRAAIRAISTMRKARSSAVTRETIEGQSDQLGHRSADKGTGCCDAISS